MTATIAKMAPRIDVSLELEHKFCGGVYARTMRARKGTLIRGARHKTENFFCLTKGKLRVWDIQAEEFHEITAPFLGRGEVGSHRIGYVLEDIEWTNYFEVGESRQVEHLEMLLGDWEVNANPLPDDLVKQLIA